MIKSFAEMIDAFSCPLHATFHTFHQTPHFRPSPIYLFSRKLILRLHPPIYEFSLSLIG